MNWAICLSQRSSISSSSLSSSKPCPNSNWSSLLRRAVSRKSWGITKMVASWRRQEMPQLHTAVMSIRQSPSSFPASTNIMWCATRLRNTMVDSRLTSRSLNRYSRAKMREAIPWCKEVQTLAAKNQLALSIVQMVLISLNSTPVLAAMAWKSPQCRGCACEMHATKLKFDQKAKSNRMGRSSRWRAPSRVT